MARSIRGVAPRGRTRCGRRQEAGAALAVAIFSIAVLLISAAGALLVGSADMGATRNYRGSQQAHSVAESAIAEALQSVNNPGVTNFAGQVGNIRNNYPAGGRAFAPLNGFFYTVNASPAPGDPTNRGTLSATATGPEGTTNVVVANVFRAALPVAPGAIYLATNNPTASTFDGDSFLIDGKDTKYSDHSAGTAQPVPGIATRTDANTTATKNSLSTQQDDNVQGLGYQTGSPPTPSIFTSPAAPDISQMNAIINALLAQPSPPRNECPTGNCLSYGSTSAPLISHLGTSGQVGTFKLTGNIDGDGILIVEGDLTILGNFSFNGLILVRGQFQIGQVQTALQTEIGGSANIYGSVWTQNIKLDVHGNAQVHYSSEALQLANSISGGQLPTPLQVQSLADCAQVPAGSGGC